MTKTIKTLVADMQEVLLTGRGYTEEVANWVSQDIKASLQRQMQPRKHNAKANLRMSSLGKPCERQLWYSTREDYSPEPMRASTLNKFIFGDLTESHMLGLAMAAGHSVTGMQDKVTVFGINGSRDCIIDGMLIDVKSASTRAFEKFKYNKLREDDSFGYISQLSSYLYGSQDDPLLTEKTKAGFLVGEKQFGHICLDVYDLSDELANKEAEVLHKKEVVASDDLPPRGFDDVPHNKSGNRKLNVNCSYCDSKWQCWSNLRAFAYSNGPVYITHLEKEPTGNVMEITPDG